VSLIVSIAANIIITLVTIYRDRTVTGTEVAEEISKRLELVAWAVLTFILSFGSDYIEKKENIDIPDILEICIVVFIYAGLYLSARFNLYYRYFWWDDLLHTLSGVITGFIGFIVIYKINCRYSTNLSPLLVALFSFTFAVTLGVLWEILEFASDVVFGTTNQKWDLPATAVLLGKPYQGSGLRDTMSDLIVDTVGALITSVITYFLYKNRKASTLARMKKIFNQEGRSADKTDGNGTEKPEQN
jgi:uncharacterized membrane protein